MYILHALIKKLFLEYRCRFNADHMSNAFIDHESLMLFQVFLVVRNGSDQIAHIRILFRFMFLHKHVFSQLGYFQEGLTSHILDTWVFFMHELIQFLNHSFQESPV